MHIEKFIERLQGFDLRGSKDFIMPLKDAKALHAEITRLLLNLERLQTSGPDRSPDSVPVIEISGKPF
jgi:hypothetical protein